MSIATDMGIGAEPEVDRRSARITCYIDIETASQPAWLARQAVDAGVEPGPETRLWVLEHAADGATSPYSGQVVCWAVAIDQHDTVCMDDVRTLRLVHPRLAEGRAA